MADLDVSGRHAVFTRTAGGSWAVRDLGSTNGTFVNGRRLEDEHPLVTGDRVRFGLAGPEVEFRGLPTAASSSGAAALTAASWHVLGAPDARAERAAAASYPETSFARDGASRGTTPSGPSKPPAAPSTRRLWLLVFPLVLLVGAAVLALQAARRGALLEGERVALQQRIDSLTTSRADSILALEGELRELSDALRESREEVRQASLRLEQAQRAGTPAEVASLREQLDAATAAARDRPEGDAGLDLLEIQRLNRHAVAVIWVEDEAGEVSTGTAFAVRSDATLVTSRHVVAGESGTQRPRRIAVQFSDSDQVWPARILVVGADADLALVKVDNILGEVPTIRALNTRPDTLRAGTIVASIGFPVGRGPSAASAGGRSEFASPLLSAGIVSATTPERLEFQGYGAAGASGSPVFDHTGAVVAVLFGGLTDTAHPTLVGVPATAVAALIERLP